MIDQTKIDGALPVISTHIHHHNQTDLTSDDILEIIHKFNALYQLNEDEINHLLKVLEKSVITRMGTGVSLINTEIIHDVNWYKDNEFDWNYWKDYQQLLLNQGWPTRVVHSMDNVTNNILGLLKNPQEEGDWERRGLIIGHVQSGKTANYIALLTKAADAGYKFIIVIAGIHNNLRTQTQERIDKGFIGRDSVSKQLIGVGELRADRDTPVTVTNTESDFNKTVQRRFNLELKSLHNTFILVIKKNVNTLRSLYHWLKELNTRAEYEKIADIPMLMIDDEADNASINTNKPELDPTRTNREIRNILNLFKKCCYVGYTATPFANIFINPDSYDPELGSDLFPEHFIYCLDAPTNYFGTEKIFLDDESYDKHIRIVDDAEAYLPMRHRKDTYVEALPPSLRSAIRTFILSRAIRNLRGHSDSHCSMLINVSRFVDVQRDLSQLTEIYIKKLQDAVRYNYRRPIDEGLRNQHMQQLHQTFLDEYQNENLKWEDLLDLLQEAIAAAKVYVVNSRSGEKLDYQTATKEGTSLTAIAIGGLSLSRGLTIEGLTVSYIYRNSKMYDTLMQMGRWFGYRDGYENLCRVYMSEASYEWYSHIAEATEELRLQIKQMQREKKKPVDFGLFVRAHPDTLIVTARNKMRNADDMEIEVTYHGAQKDTYLVPDDERTTRHNQELVRQFFGYLSGNQEPIQSDYKGNPYGAFLFQNIRWEAVQNFTFEFEYHSYWLEQSRGIREYIQEVSREYPEWDVIFQSLRSSKLPEFELSDDTVQHAQLRTVGYDRPLSKDIDRKNAKLRLPPSDTENGWFVGSKNRFSGNSMFTPGFTDEELNQIAEDVRNSMDLKRSNPIHRDYTNARGKPLLLIHILTLQDKHGKIVMEHVPALSFSFVGIGTVKIMKYTVNPVWLKNFNAEMFDTLEEEDDYEPNPQ